ncbi:Alpha/Beta hydrolase protein [Infundibulicybe gibba]|nr:Alpha/Beta hydrolase protein [Infundibulicybe gibba]
MASPGPLPIENVTTLAYKTLSDSTPVYLDIYPPVVTNAIIQRLLGIPPVILFPVIVYFHGGGLTVGDRRSWLPHWLRKRANDAGYFFISADYHLIPDTGHAIVKDILDLFEFLGRADLSKCIQPHPIHGDGTTPTLIYKVDPDAIVVAGSSAGGLCAYLAAFHCISPKPKAILSIYELLDPSGFLSYLHPYPSFPSLSELVESPLAYHPESSPTPGYPANPRMLLARLYLQLGVFLDYYTAEHTPSLSGLLRRTVLEDSERAPTASIQNEKLQSLIPEYHRSIFPQFNVSSIWPQLSFPISESIHLHDLLVASCVPTHLIIAKGEEHSFDYSPGAEVTHHQDFEMIMDLLKQYIKPDI